MEKTKRIIIPVLIILGFALIVAAFVFPQTENVADAGISIANSRYIHLYINGVERNYIEGSEGNYTFEIEVNIGGSPLFYGADFTIDGWDTDRLIKNIVTSGRHSYTIHGTGTYSGDIDVYFDVFIPLSTPQPNTLTYTGQAQELIGAGTAKGATVKYSLSENTGFSTEIPKGTNAGTYRVYYAMFIGTEHSTVKHIDVSIAKAPLKVKADELSIAKGSALKSIPISYQGFVNGESSEALSGEILLNSDYTSSSPLGDYTVNISGQSSSNYDISYTNAALHCIEYNPEFTAPEPVRGLTFDGSVHKLIIPGHTVAPEAYFTYSFEENGLYSSSVPQDYKGGEYRIWYRVNTPKIICDYPQGYIDTEIKKLAYDMSGIRFEGTSVAFDGQLHKIEITGTLPEGVTVEYENNSQTRPGKYTVTAIFTGSETFAEIEPMTATLIIRDTSLSAETEPGKNPVVIMETPDGFDPDIRIIVEEKEKSSYSLLKFQKYGRMFTKIYDVKIMKGETVLDPSDISSTGNVKVKVLIPEGLDPSYMISVLNANSKKDIEEIIVDSSVIDGRYIVLETDDVNELILISSGTPYCYWHYILAAGIVLYLTLFLISYIKFKKKKFNAFNITLNVLYFALIVAAFFLTGTSCYICLGFGIGSVIVFIAGMTLLALGHKQKPEKNENKKVFQLANEDIDFYRLIAKELNHDAAEPSLSGGEDDRLNDEITNEDIEKYIRDLDESDFAEISKEKEEETEIEEEELIKLFPLITNEQEEQITEITEEKNEAAEESANENPEEISVPDIETTLKEEETVVVSKETAFIPDIEDDDELNSDTDDDEFLESEIIDENGNRITVKYLKSYKAKLILSKSRTKQFYSILKNEILSYKNVKSRISWPAEKFRSGRKTIIMFKVTGNELSVYFDLDPKAYSESEYLIEDVSEIKTYASTPAMCKIVAKRRLDNAMKLIEAVMDKYGIKKDKGFNIDYTVGLREKEIPELIEQGLIKEIRKEDGGVSPVMTAKLKTNPVKDPEIKK